MTSPERRRRGTPPRRYPFGPLETALVALVLLSCAGCTNTPGALELRIAPEKETFRTGEPIRLRAVLSATTGNVCYGRASPWCVTLERGDGSAPLRNRPEFICGTGLAPLMPLLVSLYVLAMPVWALDVGDGLGRFDVIPRGKQRMRELTLTPDDGPGSRWLEVTEGGEPGAERSHTAVPLPAGRYHVRLELCNQYTGPAPLFWAPYEHPLVATTEFTVADGAAQAAPP